MTVHSIDVVVKRLREEADKCVLHAYVCKADVLAVCDEIEKLERDVELAKQDWTA
jgi:hypothetical protein